MSNYINELMIQTCTVVRATTLTAANPLDPQGGTITGVDFANPAATTTGVLCRLMPITPKQKAELAASNTAGTVVASHIMYMPWASAPGTLSDLDANPHPSVTHRVKDVKTAAGAMFHAGPFDIQYAYDPASTQELLILTLTAVT